MLVKKSRSLLLLYIYLIGPGTLFYQEPRSFRIPVASFTGAGSDVKGQYAGCIASGQPLTKATRKTLIPGDGSPCAAAPCLPARGESRYSPIDTKKHRFFLFELLRFPQEFPCHFAGCAKRYRNGVFYGFGNVIGLRSFCRISCRIATTHRGSTGGCPAVRRPP